MQLEHQKYARFELVNIIADNPDEVNGNEGNFIRVVLPADTMFVHKMNAKGFVFGDRTIGVSINLKRSRVEYSKLVRFEMHETSVDESGLEILRIAKEIFPTDRRFHVRPELNQDIADEVLDKWVRELNHPVICIHKDKVVGFLDLEEINEKTIFIHLAAVEKQYRAAGAALSMYAYALEYARKKGYETVAGRISSLNTAVMNLYAYLGASFSEPQDVYLKEVR